MKAYTLEIKQLLSNHILFNTLAEAEKKEIESFFQIKEYKENDIIAEQFAPIEGMYHICSGKVRVKQTILGRREILGDFEQEQTFGELSLIKTCSWEYQIDALSPNVVVLILPSSKIHKFIKAKPNVLKTFMQFIGKVELSHRLKGMLGAAKYSKEQFNEILNNFGIKKISKGKPIFEEGSKDPRLYLIESGTVDLIKKISNENIVLDRCIRSEIIGERAALLDLGQNGIHPYTAHAVTDVTVLVIGNAEVQKILFINPGLHESLKERAKYLINAEKTEFESLNRQSRDTRLKIEEGITREEFKRLEKEKQIDEIPVIRQRDESECSAACLTIISKYYHKNFTLGQIKELMNVSDAYHSPIAIITGAENLGYNSCAYALTFNDLKNVRLPGIIGWEGSHYAVIYRVSGKKAYIVDPAFGKKILSKEEFIKGWTKAEIPGVTIKEEQGLFIGFNPTANFLKLATPQKPIYHFISYLLPYKKFFIEAMLAAVIINLLGLASPLFVQSIVDVVVVHKDTNLLNYMLGGMVLVTIFTTITRVVQRLLLSHTTARVNMSIMAEFYRHILSLPMSFFLTRNKGEILARFGENTKILNIITGSTINIILNTLMLIIYFLMMFSYSLKLTIIVIAFIPAYIALILYYTPKIKEIAQKIFITNSQTQSFLIESLNGIETIKATANEYMARARWENAFVENVNFSFEQANLNLISASLHGLITLASNVLILWVGANQVISGAISIGELMGFNMLVNLVMGPVQQMVQLWNQMQEIRISIDRVSDILNVKPEQEPISSPEQMQVVLQQCDGRIEFSKVNFSYISGEKENNVIKDLDLLIEPGQHVAFVGPSGCGKTTIAKMIIGFNIPKSGECRVDGKNIVDLDLNSLRKHIGVVLQDSFLISGNVAQNIALGDPDPDMIAVKQAARLAGIDADIVKWPLGYQTLIGEKGMGISGGQRQRVCIARALYNQPKILIFDEATSALDNESEKNIQSNMHEIRKGRTSITIAHRLTTIVNADLICYIQNGKVVEKGSHEQLIDPSYLKKNNYSGYYYRLAQGQFNLKPLEIN